MRNFLQWLLKSKSSGFSLDMGLLLLRLLFGLTLSFRHGWPTMKDWWAGNINYPDPLGLGENLTMLLMGTAEAVFTVFIAIGLFTRLSACSLTLGFATAFFVVHAVDPFHVKELPFLYLCGMLAIFILGPGKYSIDWLVWSRKGK